MQPVQATAVDLPENGLRTAARTVLFMALFFFYWISLHPFVDLTGAVGPASVGGSDKLNQIVTLALSGGILLFGMLHSQQSVILQPRVLLVPLFAWFLFVSIISNHPMLGIKGVVLAILVTANASVYLLVPVSERHFAKMLAFATLAALALSYYGIAFRPALSIHQASELREPTNVGLWRGHFQHKNTAAASMVVFSFFGLFVMAAWSRLAGALIVVLATFFLLHTGGKTASAMLPATLVIVWMFERFPLLRIPIAVGGLALLNLFTVGSVLIAPFGMLLADLGVDPTFTNRDDIWRLAFPVIADNPFLGVGFRNFWQTEELIYSGGDIETWAVTAANAHNAYLDTLLAAGIPGLVLTLVWVLVLPLRDFGRMQPEAQHSPLTRLYTRIWLYMLFNASLESFLYDGGSNNMLWFAFALALYGLRLQASAQVIRSTGRA